MAASNNPFYVEPANPLQALMAGVQGFDRADERYKQDQLEQAFKQLGPQIQQGGLDNTALGTLFGLGPKAPPMITAAAQFKKAMGENEAYYGVPIYSVGPDGNVQVSTFNKKGNVKPPDFGQGNQVLEGIKTINSPQGTYIVGGKTGALQGNPGQVTGY